MAKSTTWTANLSKDLMDVAVVVVAEVAVVHHAITTMTTIMFLVIEVVVVVDSMVAVDVEVVVDPADAFRDQGADISIEIGLKDRCNFLTSIVPRSRLKFPIGLPRPMKSLRLRRRLSGSSIRLFARLRSRTSVLRMSLLESLINSLIKRLTSRLLSSVFASRSLLLNTGGSEHQHTL